MPCLPRFLADVFKYTKGLLACLNFKKPVTDSGGQISTKHQKTSIKPFFATCRLPQYPEFAKNLRSFDGFDQMSAFWSMFWFKSFRNFLRKIAIFRTFDHWSEILSLSAGRPLSQGVCPALALPPPSGQWEMKKSSPTHNIPFQPPPPSSCFRRPVGGEGKRAGNMVIRGPTDH
jgi:hypothetical protein